MLAPIILGILGVFAALPVTATALYALDDSRSELQIGVSTPGDDLLVGNIFEAQAGGDVITAILVAFQTSTAAGATSTAGLPVELILYNDPDNDGDFSDRDRLSSMVGAVADPGTDTFIEFAIAPTAVSGFFMVAAFFDELPEAFFPIAADTNELAGRTVGVQDNVNPDTSTLFNLPTVNAMIRAVGSTVSIPEPATGVLLLGALLLLRGPVLGRTQTARWTLLR